MPYVFAKVQKGSYCLVISIHKQPTSGHHQPKAIPWQKRAGQHFGDSGLGCGHFIDDPDGQLHQHVLLLTIARQRKPHHACLLWKTRRTLEGDLQYTQKKRQKADIQFKYSPSRHHAIPPHNIKPPPQGFGLQTKNKAPQYVMLTNTSFRKKKQHFGGSYNFLEEFRNFGQKFHIFVGVHNQMLVCNWYLKAAKFV